MNLTEKIRKLLENNNISYREVEHEPAPTCELSASARGEDIAIGGKTILFKDKKDFRIFVISAKLQIDSNRVRKILKSDRLRFATNQELLELTGAEKGALPPFGRPLFPFDLYVDESIRQNSHIAFNAGILTKSFIIKVEDYLKIVDPLFCQFSR